MIGDMATVWLQESVAISSHVATSPVVTKEKRTPKKILNFVFRELAGASKTRFLPWGIKNLGYSGDMATSHEIAGEICNQSIFGFGDTGDNLRGQP